MKNPYVEKLKTIRELKKLWNLLPFNPTSSGLSVSCLSSGIVVQIRQLKNLTSARNFVKFVYPEWQDELINIVGSSFASAVAIWKDKTYPLIEIWLRTPVNKFPKELLPSEKCQFEKQTEEEYTLVCPVGE